MKKNLEEFSFDGSVFREVNVIESTECIDDITLGILQPQILANGQCVENAKKVALETGAELVEGVVLICLDRKTRFVRHCWNLKDEKHFDLTKDFVWKYNPITMYFPVASFELHEYKDLKNGDVFLSNVVAIVDALNEEKN